MSIRARCKFTVTELDEDQDGHGTVKLETEYDAELSVEDEAFSQVTPWGSMEFGIDNPNLAGFFEVGRAFYVDLIPVEEVTEGVPGPQESATPRPDRATDGRE